MRIKSIPPLDWFDTLTESFEYATSSGIGVEGFKADVYLRYKCIPSKVVDIFCSCIIEKQDNTTKNKKECLEMVSVNLLVPLFPFETTFSGILVIVDRYSLIAALYPLMDQTKEHIENALDRFIQDYAQPASIHPIKSSSHDSMNLDSYAASKNINLIAVLKKNAQFKSHIKFVNMKIKELLSQYIMDSDTPFSAKTEWHTQIHIFRDAVNDSPRLALDSKSPSAFCNENGISFNHPTFTGIDDYYTNQGSITKKQIESLSDMTEIKKEANAESPSTQAHRYKLDKSDKLRSSPLYTLTPPHKKQNDYSPKQTLSKSPKNHLPRDYPVTLDTSPFGKRSPRDRRDTRRGHRRMRSLLDPSTESTEDGGGRRGTGQFTSGRGRPVMSDAEFFRGDRRFTDKVNPNANANTNQKPGTSPFKRRSVAHWEQSQIRKSHASGTKQQKKGMRRASS